MPFAAPLRRNPFRQLSRNGLRSMQDIIFAKKVMYIYPSFFVVRMLDRRIMPPQAGMRRWSPINQRLAHASRAAFSVLRKLPMSSMHGVCTKEQKRVFVEG